MAAEDALPLEPDEHYDNVVIQRVFGIGSHGILLKAFLFLRMQLAKLHLEVKNRQQWENLDIEALVILLEVIIKHGEHLLKAKAEYREAFDPLPPTSGIPTAMESVHAEFEGILSGIRSLKPHIDPKHADRPGMLKVAIEKVQKLQEQVSERFQKLLRAVKDELSKSAASEAGPSATASLPPKTEPKMAQEPMTVLSLDMVGYGATSRQLQRLSFANAKAVFEFNDGLVKIMIKALELADLLSVQKRRIGTGDGAIYFFQTPAQAVKFLEYLNEEVAKENRTREECEILLRIGIRRGLVYYREEVGADGKTERFEAAGTAIADAVRLQTDCKPGQAIVCKETHKHLSPEQHDLFLQHGYVKGKPHENLRIEVYRSKAPKLKKAPQSGGKPAAKKKPAPKKKPAAKPATKKSAAGKKTPAKKTKAKQPKSPPVSSRKRKKPHDRGR